MKKHREIYLSLDIEANGPIPGSYSMLSLGAAAFDIEGRLLGTFSRNLLPLEGSSSHPDTDAFWAKNPKAYSATQIDRAIRPRRCATTTNICVACRSGRS